MVIDKINRLSDYRLVQNGDLLQIRSFIEKCRNENLKDGRYELREGELIALVQTYVTRNKSECKMESHVKNADIQVLLSGKEMVFWTDTGGLTISEDHADTGDYILYEQTQEQGMFYLEEGMFAYFAPWDGHAPSVTCLGEKEALVKKIVFKSKLDCDE